MIRPAIQPQPADVLLKNANARRAFPFVAGVVGTLAIAYLAIGFFFLCFSSSGAADLRRRWLEQRYFLSGVNPNEASALSAAAMLGQPTPIFPSGAKLSPEIGLLPVTAYPPWSYAMGTILVPTSPWWLTRTYFSLLNVGALVFCAGWAYRRGAKFSNRAGVFLSLSTLAIFANAITLRHGQYSILTNAFLLGVLLCEERRRPWLSGILLALSALKPNVALLYFLVLLVRGNFAGLATATILILGTAFVGATHVHSNLIAMTLEGLKQPHDWIGHLGFFEPLTYLVSAEHVSIIGLAAGILISASILWKFRRMAVLDLMAVAAIVGQLCTYHRRYDQVNMLFPLIALGLLAVRRPRWQTWSAFLVFGASLWLPHRDTYLTIYPLALIQYLAWIFGLVVLLRNQGDAITETSRLSTAEATI